MNRWKVSTLLFAGLFVSTVGFNLVQRAHAEKQPHMEAALGHLEGALAELHKAEHDKGGWRAAAVRSTEAAIVEVKRGIAFDNKH